MQLLFRETVPALFTRPETDECGHLWTTCSGTGHHVFRHEGTQFPNLFQPVRNNGKQAVSLPRSGTSLFAAGPGAEEHPAGAPRQSNPCRHLKRLHIKQEKPCALQHSMAWREAFHSFFQFFGYSAEVLFRCLSQFLLLFPVPCRSFRHPGLIRQPTHGAARVTACFLLNDFQQLSDIFIHGFRVDIISIPMPG